MPNSKVKASADAKLPPPSISKMNESGMSNIETRPTSIGCHWRASVRSQMRPTTCAMPLSEAIATATPAASLEASNIATRCTAMAPNTTALAATMRLNSNIANRRAAPSRGALVPTAAPSGARTRDAGASASRRARPAQCSGAQTNRFAAANISSVPRQP